MGGQHRERGLMWASRQCGHHRCTASKRLSLGGVTIAGYGGPVGMHSRDSTLSHHMTKSLVWQFRMRRLSTNSHWITRAVNYNDKRQKCNNFGLSEPLTQPIATTPVTPPASHPPPARCECSGHPCAIMPVLPADYVPHRV